MARRRKAPPAGAMNVVMRPTDEIRPYERNPRRNDQAVDAVAASILKPRGPAQRGRT
jgi:hypothetical protein